MKKWLIINQYAGSDKHGMEFRPNYISQSIRKIDKDISVEILCASYTHMRKQNFVFKGFYKKEMVDNVVYHIIKTNSYNGNGIGRLISILTFSILASMYIAFKLKNFSAVILSSTHTLDFFSGFVVKFKMPRCKVIFEPHDLWPLAIIELSGKSKWHPVVLLFALGEYLTIKCADLYISMHPGNIHHLKKFGVQPKHFLHAPNGIFDLDYYDLLYSRKRDNSGGLFTIGYTGTVNAANNLGIFIEALSQSAFKDKISLKIVGDGDCLEIIKEMARDKKINLNSVGRLSKNAALQETVDFDVGILGFHDIPFYQYGVSANKIWDYMGLGVPILGVYNSCNDPIEEGNCGLSINNFCVEDVRKSIDFLYLAESEVLKKFSKNGRLHVFEKNNYKAISKSIISFITSFD